MPPLAPSPARVFPAARAAPARGQVVAFSAFIAAHILLALLMHNFRIIATVHAVTCLLVGLGVALTTRRIRDVAMVAAYIAGSEVLWRMNKAAVFWEFSKYSIVAMLCVALARVQIGRNRILAPAYFALLLPSIALTFATLDFDAARQEVSFALAGPLAIMVAVLFFSNIRLDVRDVRRVFFALIGPVVGVAALSFVSIQANSDLDFGNVSNFAASGAFGPNQVAAMLGLAAMLLVLLCFERVLAWRLRAPMVLLATILAAQAVLTFARGGIVLALAGLAAALWFLLRGSRRGRLTVAFVGLVIFALGKYVVEPQLDDITGGKLSERYSNTKSSGRDQFISSELEMFEENPLLGVGPGIGMHLRNERDLLKGPSHTEYTRMLAEHGILGLLALACLVALAVRAIRQARDPASRAHAAAMVTWFGLFLAVYGTRLAAPAVVLGLAFAVRSDPPRPVRKLAHA